MARCHAGAVPGFSASQVLTVPREGQRSEVEVTVKRGVLGSLPRLCVLGLGRFSNTQRS